MKIRSHPESHLVELEDGSHWQIFPGDLDVTLGWLPDTDLKVIAIKGSLCSHVLVNVADGSQARVLAEGQPWRETDVKQVLKEG